ncbi:MAG TPA: type I methionyl aminopeptidase [Anaerovoracaceae bacterium]|nr:type I methionyl aminopeptidase [Anaerovoracaceae bacterium]
MIIIKSEDEIRLMEKAGSVTALILQKLPGIIRPGISTKELNDFVEATILENGMIPAFKGYNGFPAGACISINDEVVHGIPTAKRKLCDGDIVSVDIGTIYKGYYSDAARTYPVGRIDEDSARLITVTRESFYEGLKFCKVGYRLSDISHAIQQCIENNGFSVVRDYVGHGIGKEMHEDPHIPNYGAPGRGPRLAAGMTFAIEPMVNEGGWQVAVSSDDWTVKTKDGKKSAHYENTVAITEDEPLLLTKLSGIEEFLD